MSLTNKQQLFLVEYLRDRNAYQAAIRAGYSVHTARAQGSRLLTNVDIRDAIDEEIKKRAMPADEVLRGLSEIASGDISELMHLTTAGFTTELLEEDENGERRAKPQTKLIKKIKQRVTTIIGKKADDEDKEIVETEFELYSRLEALTTLAKYHGLLVDRHVLSDPSGDPIVVKLVTDAGS